jgi:hypothetical protein
MAAEVASSAVAAASMPAAASNSVPTGSNPAVVMRSVVAAGAEYNCHTGAYSHRCGCHRRAAAAADSLADPRTGLEKAAEVDAGNSAAFRQAAALE